MRVSTHAAAATTPPASFSLLALCEVERCVLRRRVSTSACTSFARGLGVGSEPSTSAAKRCGCIERQPSDRPDRVTPPLRIREAGGRIRLGLDGFGAVEGATLQEAANELVLHLLRVALALRAGGIGPLCSECSADAALLEFVWQLGEVAASGGDPRELLFGPNPIAA